MRTATRAKTACPSGKHRYRDRIAAALALESARRRSGWKRRETRMYRCPGCNGWHLTSQRRA